MVERLRRVGLRAIHPVVDITNYVMMEYGQPLHAYDLGLVQGAIRPRLARQGEKVVLLDDKEVTVNADTLLITDDSGPIGLAGIMGGLSTAVSDKTVDVFFEAAYWPQKFMAGQARSYGMHTDASMRFERGVDPNGQARAVERATSLLIEISGGQAGPLAVATSTKHILKRPAIRLRRDRLSKLLGAEISEQIVTGILERLGMEVTADNDGWSVVAPSYRFDIAIEADLIEEVARIYGFDQIPETTAIGAAPLQTVTESSIEIDAVAATLVARDYQEVVTYSFVDVDADTLVSGCKSELVLSNPISSEMSVMRSSLWPGMFEVASANAARQQERIRLFEVGKSFHGSLKQPSEVDRIAAFATGAVLPEQWGSNAQAIDFYDVKADVTAILRLSGNLREFSFVDALHPALQPGQTANVVRDGKAIGVLGKCHPKVLKHFDLKRTAFVFELDAKLAMDSAAPRATTVSRYPMIRRDIAIVVNQEVSADDLLRAAESAAPDLIKSVRIFDVYRGPGIEAGRKSVALGLILQETSRTLTDDDADSAMAAAVQKLQQEFAAELRD
jgi:phenylalanyl-tRNA synthetase beta chain